MSQEEHLEMELNQQDLIDDAEITAIDQNKYPARFPSPPPKFRQQKPRQIQIFSCYVMYLPIWHEMLEDLPGSRWRGMPWHTLDQMVEAVTYEIVDQKPKQITIACWDRRIGVNSNKEILDASKLFIKLVDEDKTHQLSFASVQFPPDKQKYFAQIAELNSELRKLNISRQVPPLSLHKSLMKHLYDDNSGPLICRGPMWKQFVDKTGLGSEPSNAGYDKMRKFLTPALRLQFVNMKRKASRQYSVALRPPPLCTLEEYREVPEMVQFLKDKGEYNIRPASTSNIPTTPKKVQPQRTSSASNQPPRPKSTPLVTKPRSQSGASATTAEKKIDFEKTKPTPGYKPSWYGKDCAVIYTPENQRRKLVLNNKENDESFEDEVQHVPIPKTTEQVNYNEGNESLRDKIERRKNKPDTSNDELDQVKSRLAREQKENKEKETTIEKLNDYLDEEEDITKKQKKELDELRLNTETLKLEMTTKDQKIEKLERSLLDAQERLKLLQNLYDYAKQLNEDRNQWTNKSSKKKRRT